MKFTWFNLMPWPYLPDDFRTAHRSVWVDIPNQLYDPEKGHFLYHRYMDLLEYADALGFDGIGCNEHHQNGYGLMPSPNLIAAGLARRTSRAAIAVIGNSLALYNPPIRVAEEFAMLDVLSGGRLLAGFPVGTSMDTNYCYGQIPALTRDKYAEAHELVMRAWQSEEPFAFDGKYNQLRYVNLWPRPIQKPHPPVYIPGGGSIETWDFCVDHDYNYSYLSFTGYLRGKKLLDGYWDRVAKKGKDESPYRAAFAQTICVAETDQEAEELYAEHVSYFYNRCLHVYLGFADAPGYRTIKTIQANVLNALSAGVPEPVHDADLEAAGRRRLHHRRQPGHRPRPHGGSDQGPARRPRLRPLPHRRHAGLEDALLDASCSPSRSCRTCATCGRSGSDDDRWWCKPLPYRARPEEGLAAARQDARKPQ